MGLFYYKGMEKAYVYYSYEQFGRGYIGARNRSPVDDEYFGTYSESTFEPTEKIVLAEFDTWEEALEAEVRLHAFFEVDINPHFANKAKQTSSGFYFDATGRNVTEEEKEKNRKSWTPERRAAQAARMAAQNRSDRHRQSMRESNPMFKEEVRDVLREANLGENNPNFGKKSSEKQKEASRRTGSRPKSAETRRRMSEAAKNRKRRG